MGGFMGVAAKQDCVFDLYFGIDYHSHLGTRRGGMVMTKKKDLTDQSTILKMHLLELNLIKICRV